MEYLPTAVVMQMIRNKKSDMVYKLRYKDKSYRLYTYSFSKTDLAKIVRVDGQAAMYVGSFVDKGKAFDLHAKSMSIDEIKKTVTKFPLVAVLAVKRGSDSEGNDKFVAAISTAYKDPNDIDLIKRKSIAKYLEYGRVKDSQRQQEYKWEWNNLTQLTGKMGTTKIKLSSMNRAIKALISHFGLPAEKIHVSNSGTRSKTRAGVCRAIRDDVSSENPNFVIVDVHDSTIDTLIHEASHMIVSFKYPRNVQSHGAEFCGVFAHLLSLFYPKLKEADIVKSMKQHGLKVKPFVTPKKKFDFSFKIKA